MAAHGAAAAVLQAAVELNSPELIARPGRLRAVAALAKQQRQEWGIGINLSDAVGERYVSYLGMWLPDDWLNNSYYTA